MNKLFLIFFISFSNLYCGELNVTDKISTAWFNAIRKNKVKKINQMIDSGLDVNLLNKQYETALFWAIDCFNVSLVKLLLKKGAFPNPHPKAEFFSPLISAISKRNIKIVKLLLQYGADPNYTINIDDKPAFQPIHIAVNNEDYEITKLLLEYGANPNIIVWFDETDVPTTVLIDAIRKTNTELVELLLNYKTDPNLSVDLNKSHFTPLMFAIISKNVRIIESLLKAGANYKQVLDICSTLTDHDKLKRRLERKEIFSLILSQALIDRFKFKTFEIYNKKGSEKTKLYIEELIKHLKSKEYIKQIFLLLKDRNNNTLLHKAVIKKDYKFIEFILNYNPEIISELLSLPNKQKMTCIDLSVANESLLNFFMELAYIKKDKPYFTL